MFRYLSTRHNLRNDSMFSMTRRYYTDENGVKHPATDKLAILHMRFHTFHRMDDKVFHNHNFEFWTFPFVRYVEEFLFQLDDGSWTHGARIIEPFRWTYKNATEFHRILGPCDKDGVLIPNKKIRTMIWRGHIQPPGSTGFMIRDDFTGDYNYMVFEDFVKMQAENDARKGKG